MKHIISEKIETYKEIDVVTPSYYEHGGTYFKLTEHNRKLYVTRVCILKNYQSIIKTTNVTSECFGNEITEEEFNLQLSKIITDLTL